MSRKEIKMAVETLTTPRSELPNVFTNVSPREIDFVTRFGTSWQALAEIIGIMDPVKKEAGTRLVSYTASVALEDGDVPEGAVIPYSKATVTEVKHADLELKKYAKAVTVEDVNKYGDRIAVQKTDDAFLNELQNEVIDDFYGFIASNTSTLDGTEATWQMAVAMAIGKVRDKFKKMRKNVSNIVVFVNTLDAYKYIGSTDITIQTLFGIDYVQNIMGAQTMILSSEIPVNEVVAIPVDNLVLYYIDPSSAFASLGLTYATDGETNLIGFHAQGNYNTAVGESFALMGMKLWAEYVDGIAKITVEGA